MELVAFVLGWVALAVGSWGVFLSSRAGWTSAARRLEQEIEDATALQRRELIKLRDEWAEYGEKLTKRYRATARALAELERRDAANDPEPEPDDVPGDDEPPRRNGSVPALPPHMVASGAFGAGRAG